MRRSIRGMKRKKRQRKGKVARKARAKARPQARSSIAQAIRLRNTRLSSIAQAIGLRKGKARRLDPGISPVRAILFMNLLSRNLMIHSNMDPPSMNGCKQDGLTIPAARALLGGTNDTQFVNQQISMPELAASVS